MKNSKNYIWMGLIIVLVASLLNGQLVRLEIGGLLREGMRLLILAGLGMMLFGFIKKFSKK